MRIVEKIGIAAAFEQLAEESCELGHAALKAARKLRGENPTPVSLSEALDGVMEEFNDVLVSAAVAQISSDNEICSKKLSRWQRRLGLVEDETSVF